jgi:Xaa-Pro aminopeptidase
VERHAVLAGLDGGPALQPLGRLIEELRMVKDDAEIALLARACGITVEAFAAVLGLIEPGRTERSFAVALERAMIDLGASGLAFDSIVASGPNGAIPHHSPGDRPFQRGDLITIDCGAEFCGYHADMTRTVALGEPDGWQREIYDLVAAAQRAGVAAALPGAEISAVDAAARELIAAAGHAEHFGHGLGHGVGLEVHEAPMMGPGRAGKLEDRVPVTVEPGVYVPGRGGVRIEDTLVVRSGGARTAASAAGAAGSAPAGTEPVSTEPVSPAAAAEQAEVLTTTTRELLVL